ncbi:MAG: sigma-70 family RNA polymerase sigma factor [Ignavibacteria bacterium]|nr:sigma-70 family RNA polymerase sigma factor [Ignavibacteria bacterium]
MPNERKLLEKARDFDPDSLGLIYDSYSPGLFRYALRLLEDNNMAEECVADTFSRFLNALRMRHGPDNHLQAYLYRIAHNWITDSYRRQPPITVELDESYPINELEKPENRLTKEIEKQEIQNALRVLTIDQRQVIILRFIEGWSNEEVALAIQKPVGAVKALQHRALETLRKVLCPDEKVSLNGS